ncbi:hypothetical protein K437DRAFT_256319 [Tilletiaria anomala UBC 951]|uniref:P-loop containing nucleoside triphosphate hydrolase protein n=1 Tax=Tilletiaria anomala (strain ATCC 24038 / CBS 436.72 / UBC 951) TaxID=1037660 RepID=A0A066W0Q5_TILAU|nr:uncharacterized protein K437DRAFT_256319 [Tilletiaria anomala UBC 951]KDN46138.1 hypothetical protein K437DRAFT_256319 [Tilletiaria anomala UBC 951]
MDAERKDREDMNTYKERLLTEHIKRRFHSHLTRWRCMTDATRSAPPLIVGPGGVTLAGKTTITTKLKESLAQSPFGSRSLRVAIFSIDGELASNSTRSLPGALTEQNRRLYSDLYLTHQELTELAAAHPRNKLLHGRGQPGTHDMQLGLVCLQRLRGINGSFAADSQYAIATKGSVHLPIFDKSQFDGEGDRSDKTVQVEAPVDIVIFEGWCLGFAPIGREQIERRYKEAVQRAKPELKTRDDNQSDGEKAPYFLQHNIESLLELDERLGEYERKWYPLIDDFIQLRPVAPTSSTGAAATAPGSASAAGGLENVFQWRLQAEHTMMTSNGGKGMTDEQVRTFVERYMPGYELWAEQVTHEARRWHGKGLRVDIGPQREVVSVSEF